jgi:hypothetical protein
VIRGLEAGSSQGMWVGPWLAGSVDLALGWALVPRVLVAVDECMRREVRSSVAGLTVWLLMSSCKRGGVAGSRARL